MVNSGFREKILGPDIFKIRIFCSISDLKGIDMFRLDEGAKEDEAMVLVDIKGREVRGATSFFQL